MEKELNWLYETKCDRCGKKATTSYTVYSQIFQCPRCLEQVPLFDCPEIESKTANGKAKIVAVCPRCHAKGVDEEISTRSARFGVVPVMLSYVCESGCKPSRGVRMHNDQDSAKRRNFDSSDVAKLQEIEARRVPYWLPPQKMMNVEDDSKPWGAEWREGRNFRRITELFTARNLYA